MNREKIRSRMTWGGMLLLGILLTACSSGPGPENDAELAGRNAERLPHAVGANPPGGAVMLSGNTRAGDALGDMLLPRVGSGGGILAASLVDLDDLDRTSAFGRASMQQVASRLSQHGFKVLEPRLGATLRFEKRGGEFMLTRDSLRLLSDSYEAHAALVGTYSESKDKVFMSVRVVRLSDGAVLGAYEYYLPRNEDVEALLGGARAPGGNHLWSRYATREPAFPAQK